MSHATMVKLGQLQALVRKEVNFENEKEGLNFYCDVVNLISAWPRYNVPKIQRFFQPGEIDRLLADMMNFYRLAWDKCQNDGNCSVLKELTSPKNIIRFVADSCYKAEPVLDRDGRPVTRRTTALHHMARCDPLLIHCLVRDEALSDLFTIYDRFDVNYVDDDGLTHLHAACRFGCEDVVKKFLDFGANPNDQVTSTGYTTLHFALMIDHLHHRRHVWNLLLEKRANPNLADLEGRSPLHVICGQFNDWFLMKYADGFCDEEYRPLQVNARDNFGNTPLSLAMTRGQIQVVKLLLKNVPAQKSTDASKQSSSSK